MQKWYADNRLASQRASSSRVVEVYSETSERRVSSFGRGRRAGTRLQPRATLASWSRYPKFCQLSAKIEAAKTHAIAQKLRFENDTSD